MFAERVLRNQVRHSARFTLISSWHFQRCGRANCHHFRRIELPARTEYGRTDRRSEQSDVRAFESVFNYVIGGMTDPPCRCGKLGHALTLIRSIPKPSAERVEGVSCGQICHSWRRSDPTHAPCDVMRQTAPVRPAGTALFRRKLLRSHHLMALQCVGRVSDRSSEAKAGSLRRS